MRRTSATLLIDKDGSSSELKRLQSKGCFEDSIQNKIKTLKKFPNGLTSNSTKVCKHLFTKINRDCKHIPSLYPTFRYMFQNHDESLLDEQYPAHQRIIRERSKCELRELLRSNGISNRCISWTRTGHQIFNRKRNQKKRH